MQLCYTMLVKIKDKYIHIYKDEWLYKFELKGYTEPDESYLAINENSQYFCACGWNDEYPINMPQRKIRRELKKLSAK